MAGKRQHYSVGFKTKVALEALKRDLTIAQHGVHQALISSWKRQDGQFHAKVGERVVERDFLRKASGR